MRKLKLQVQITIDGFIAGENGEMDFMTWGWDDELKNYVDEITKPVDCIVLGRKLAEGFIPYWESEASNPDAPEHEAGVLFTSLPKVVFSTSLTHSMWENTLLARGDLTQEILHLKNQTGRDIIAYGGANFVSSLISQNLVDEYYLFINPAAIGRGKSIFRNDSGAVNLKLIEARSFKCGIAVLHYISLPVGDDIH